MKVFVTGASGFIGSHVAIDLAARGHDVAVLLRAGTAWRLENHLAGMTVIRGDLAAVDMIAGPLAAFAPDAVVHAAWTGVANSDRNDWAQVDNVGRSARLLQATVACGARHFIGCGSQAEYGPRNDKTSEAAQLQPTTAYGAAKVATYHVARTLCALHSMRFAWARFFSTYGPGDEPHWMVPQLIGRLLRGERPALTEGRQRWDYCHVRDAAGAVSALVEAPDARDAFNVGAGRAMTVRRIAELIRDAAAPGAELGFGEVPYRPDQVMHLEADIARIRDATGWAPRMELEAGLRETVEWYRKAGTIDAS